MRLTPSSGTAIIRNRIQWIRCGFEKTALLDDVVTLAPLELEEITNNNQDPFESGFAGIAVDRHCRVFHALPEDGEVEYVLWGKQNSLKIQQDKAHPFEISGAGTEGGGFGGVEPLPKTPLALACDESDYLYIADPDTPAVWIVDIWQHEVARQIELTAPPLDLAYKAGKVYVLLDTPGWISVSPCDPPTTLPWPAEIPSADRIDLISPQLAFVLVDAGQATAELICLHDTTIRLQVPFCTDFLIGEEHPEFGWLFVFARRPGEDFWRRRFKGRQFTPLTGLAAPQYDGRGIAIAPDSRVIYWTERGLRNAAPARTQYEEEGTVFGFALDSDNDQNEWGTVTLEACIPDGTEIRMYCLTRDDLDFGDPLPRNAPAGESVSAILLPERTPLVSTVAWAYRSDEGQRLYRDDSPRPLDPPQEDAFARYEAPVIADPGRFLWLVFVLFGTRSKTPKLRTVRAHYPGHELLRQLPKTLWREPQAKDFLRRYLAPIAGMLDEWGSVSQQRQRLLNPKIAPSEALEWLGHMIGLYVDGCWPEAAKRRLIANASSLFRLRGTLWSLRRMIELLTDAQVIIVEQFRLRGGGVVGNPQATASNSVLGGGFRVGGSIANESATPLTLSEDEAFDKYAHRFTVLVVAYLSEEQTNCIRRLIETHKPAHTWFDLCTVDTGTRVGVGLHIGLASVIGKSSGFDLLTLGDSVLGKGYLLGRPDLSRGNAAACGSDARLCPPGEAP